MSRTTLHKIEKGDPGVSFGKYATILFVLGLHEGLGELADIKMTLSAKAWKKKPTSAHQVAREIQRPFDHLKRFMAQHFGNFELVCSVDGQVAGRTNRNSILYAVMLLFQDC